MPFPLIAAALPSLLGGAFGLLSSRNAPDEQTTATGGNSSSTSSTQIDPRLQFAGQTGLQGAQNLYQAGGTPVAGLGGGFNQAQATANNFLQGGPQAGQNPFGTAGGISPYLDTVFNAAAGATQNRLGSEFGRAGRVNQPGHEQARSQELQQLAAGIYGPGYDAAANRQFGATEGNLGREQAGFNRQFGAIPQGANLAQMQQQNQQQMLNQPASNISNFLNQAGQTSPFFNSAQSQQTNQTGNVTQPIFNDPFGQAAGGALLGHTLFGGQQQPLDQSLLQSPQIAGFPSFGGTGLDQSLLQRPQISGFPNFGGGFS